MASQVNPWAVDGARLIQCEVCLCAYVWLVCLLDSEREREGEGGRQGVKLEVLAENKTPKPRMWGDRIEINVFIYIYMSIDR